MTHEDAIKWLENLKQDIGQLRHEDLWHYAQAIDEICGLLKEQEPRVLTHKEVIELDEGKSVWFEESDGSGNTFIGPMVCHGKGLFSNRYMGVDANYLYWFGRRFWNAKPTDEQRRAVKWDEDD